MNRTQFACCILLGSAFVLAGLLLSHVGSHNMTPTAYADQVINQGAFTFLTVSTRTGEDSLFVLDNVNERLVILTSDVGRKKLEIVNSVDLTQVFSGDRERDRRGSRR